MILLRLTQNDLTHGTKHTWDLEWMYSEKKFHAEWTWIETHYIYTPSENYWKISPGVRDMAVKRLRRFSITHSKVIWHKWIRKASYPKWRQRKWYFIFQTTKYCFCIGTVKSHQAINTSWKINNWIHNLMVRERNRLLGT